MKVIDNCIPLEQQNLIIKELLETKYFPWFYCDDITNQSNKSSQHRPGFSHYFIKDKKQSSNYWNIVSLIIAPFTNKPVIQCRSFLQLSLNPKLIGSKFDSPHIDFPTPHTVYLYYVINADGDTLLFKNSKIINRVSPKQGRLLIFDGSIVHTARQPKKGIRCIINFDVLK